MMKRNMKDFRRISQSNLFTHAVIFLLFTLQTPWMAWLLIEGMSSKLVGQIGDDICFVSLTRWFNRARFEFHNSPSVVPFLSYPAGWRLSHTEMSAATLAIGFPIRFLYGDIFDYNFSTLAGLG